MQVAPTDVSAIKAAQTHRPIHELLELRFSPRAFDARPVPVEALQSMLEAARWSASSGNGQPWSFIVAARDQASAFDRLVGCLSPGNQWAASAPVLGLVVARLSRPSGKPNRHAHYDCGLAMQNLVVQATALGLHVRQMGGFSPERAREQFGIPPDHEALTAFVVGYLGHPDTLDEHHRRQELEPRERHPVAEFVFTDRWGQTSPLVSLKPS